jgi:hypothetical protein
MPIRAFRAPMSFSRPTASSSTAAWPRVGYRTCARRRKGISGAGGDA